DLIFHGGVGATLEMRLFSQKALRKKLCDAGFRDLVFLNSGVPRFGIAFEGSWSLPLVARKRDFTFDRSTVGQLAREYSGKVAELTEAQRQYDDVVSRLVERGRQVDLLDKELAERGAWGKRIQEELDEAKQNLARLQADFEERTRWALALKDEAEGEAR